jgi:hypothetical protein
MLRTGTTGSGSARHAAPTSCDFDLHGIVRIRVLDATPDDVATVRRQLGLRPTGLEAEADITVRFSDVVPSGKLTYVGVHDTAFDGTRFLVLQGKGGATARTDLPFGSIGRRPEIVCERGIPAVPHLLAIVNVTALSKGVLPLHASAFNLDGEGVLVMGWSKGGKTETLLGAAYRGARYVGDEWIYLTVDGTMRGLPEPIRLWSWHLHQRPELWNARPRRQRARVAAWRVLSQGARRAARAPGPVRGLARRAVPVLERQAYVQVPPEELFGPDRIDLRGHVDAAALVLSHDAAEITVSTAHPQELSARMAASLAEERAPFMAHYRQFLFAYPERANDAIDRSAILEARLLAELFDDRPAVKVSHPYPCDLTALGTAVLSATIGARTGRVAAARSGEDT